MLGAIAYVFGYLLKFWFNIIGNYGWAVILFSITMKVILLPLTIKQQKSAEKSQELQPKLQALQEKYRNNPEQLQIEYQKFIKENKFSPFGGCLLAIVQLIVLLGVFYCVSSPIKYMEKYEPKEITSSLKEALIVEDFSGDESAFIAEATKFMNSASGDDKIKKLLKDFESEDPVAQYLEVYKATNRYHELKILKNKYDLNFLGINLGDITIQNLSDWRLWVFPVLTVIFYYLSLWMVSKKTKKNTAKMKDADGNEIEMPNMMAMNFTMPLLSGWISASVPQGMGLYWFSNSFLQVIIQLITDNLIKKEKSKDESTEVVIEAQDVEIDGKEKKDNKNNNKSKKSSKKKKK